MTDTRTVDDMALFMLALNAPTTAVDDEPFAHEDLWSDVPAVAALTREATK